MKTILYSDVYIPILDLQYINNLEERLAEVFPNTHPNACDAPIYPENGAICNDIIHHLIYESIYNLDLPDETVEEITKKLQDHIHVNAIDSGFDNTDPEYYTTDPEIQKKLQEFFDIF